MEKSLYEFENEPEPRPSFLTWLCILTFIGSGWALISCVWTYTKAGKTNFLFHQHVEVKKILLFSRIRQISEGIKKLRH